MRFTYKNISFRFLLALAILILLGITKGFSYPLIHGFYYPFFGTVNFLILLSISIYLIALFFGSYIIQFNFHIQSLNYGSRTVPQISLTFDDGPSGEITEKLLAVLEKHKIKAAFFMIGKNVEQHKNIVTKIFESGHTIGNHSYYHANMFDMQSSSKMLNEINKTNTLLQSIINKETLLFRPPFGITNPMLAKAVKKSGMHSIGWSLRSLDTMKTKEQTLKKLKRKVKNGDIILLHDNDMKIIDIVDEFITYTKQHGIEIVSLDKLLKIKTYK